MDSKGKHALNLDAGADMFVVLVCCGEGYLGRCKANCRLDKTED